MRAFVFSLFLLLAWPALAQDATPKLKVGVFNRPPLAMKDGDGRWRGLAVELWESIADRLELQYEYVETPLDEIIGKLHTGELDLALGEIGVSSERVRQVEFTQPYLTSTAGVATLRSSPVFALKQVIVGIARQGLLLVVAVMLGLLLVFSFVLWLSERSVRQTHFGGKPVHGFGSALWFAAVTMTTVGYGDKTPQTPLGRALAFIWMFLGIVLMSAFTGSVASSITVAELNSSISSLHDLTRYRNGVVAGSLAEGTLKAAGISVVSFPTMEDGVAALASKQISAFTGNDAGLRYVVRRDAPDAVRVTSLPTMHVSFAMACRPGFPHLQALNAAILDTINAPEWQRQVDRWLGPPISQ